MPVPGLTHRYPDKALFLALDTCPVYCRFCTRSYAVGLDTEEVEKFHLRVNAERWQADVRVHRLAARAGGHRHLRRRRLPAARRADHPDRRGAAGHPPRAPLPLRHQGPGGDAAEDPHRPRLDRRPHPHRGEGAHAAQGGGACTPTSTTPARSPRSPRRPSIGWSSAGITVRNQTVLQRGVNDSSADPDPAGQAAGLRERAPLLHLHARPGEGGGGPAHHLADRARRSRRTCAAPPRASTRRWSWWTPRAAAASATPTPTSTTIGTTGVSVYTSPAVRPGQLLLLLRPDPPAAARGAAALGRSRPAPRS